MVILHLTHTLIWCLLAHGGHMEGRKHYCLPQENIIWEAEAFSCVEQSSTHIINWSFCHIISCRKKKSYKSSQRLYRASIRDCLLCSPWMHCWYFIITSNSYVSAAHTFCHVILLYIVGAVLKGTQNIFLLWKMLMRWIIARWRWTKKTMEIYARRECGGGVFLIPSFHLLTFGDQSLKMFEKVTYMYIYMHLFLDYSILAYTKILLWTKHICLSTYVSVFVFMYVPPPVCLLGKVL